MQVCILVSSHPTASITAAWWGWMMPGAAGTNKGQARWRSCREPGRPIREFAFCSRCSEEPLKDSGQGNVMPWLSIKHQCGGTYGVKVKRGRQKAQPSVKRLDKSRCRAGDDTVSEGWAAPQCARHCLQYKYEVFIPPDNPMSHLQMKKWGTGKWSHSPKATGIGRTTIYQQSSSSSSYTFNDHPAVTEHRWIQGRTEGRNGRPWSVFQGGGPWVPRISSFRRWKRCHLLKLSKFQEEKDLGGRSRIHLLFIQLTTEYIWISQEVRAGEINSGTVVVKTVPPSLWNLQMGHLSL